MCNIGILSVELHKIFYVLAVVALVVLELGKKANFSKSLFSWIIKFLVLCSFCFIRRMHYTERYIRLAISLSLALP